MRELLLSAIRDACQPYLGQILEQASIERHPHLRELFDAHMIALTDFCLAGYLGRGKLSASFICGLHKAIFPRDHRQTITTPDGKAMYMVPGEYKTIPNACKSHTHPGQTNAFIAPEKVAETMAQVVDTLNASLLASHNIRQASDAILFFILDFLIIHPFGDANGRVACILADLLAIRERLSPFYFHSIKEKDLPTLYQAIEVTQKKRDLAPIYEILARHRTIHEEI